VHARAVQLLLAAAVAVATTGCIHRASGTAMAVPASELQEPASAAVARAVAVGDVTGGKRTMSSIDDAALRAALVDSLRTAGLLAEGPGAALSVDAHIVEVGTGEGGGTFDSSVKTVIRYTVRETRSRGVVIDEVVTATHVATAGDALVGAQRHTLAVEGSARKNLAALVKRLNTIQRKAPAP
jgi:hypothetical protein